MKKFGLIRFGIKAGIMSSAVYLTIDKGVWKDSETTGELYENIQNTVKPYIKPLVKQIPFEIPELPKAGDVTSTLKTAWNKGIMASCLFLVELPEVTWNYINKGTAYAYEKITKDLKALSNVENSQPNETKI